MGKILKDFKTMVLEFKEVIPDEALDIIENSKEEYFPKVPVTKEDKDKFFVKDFEELSDAVFNLLHSGIGMYIMNYSAEFKVNRKSAGFNEASELVHFAIWVLETYNKNKSSIKENYINLANKDKLKTKAELLKQIILCKQLQDELYKITFSMKSPEDFNKRLELIKVLNENECLGFRLLSSLSHHKQIDDIYIALSNIKDIHTYNIPPKPMNQNFWDSRSV